MIYWFPSYVKPVTERLAKCGWLAHNFNIAEEIQLYNPSNFREQIDKFGVQYTLNLDLNVYQFIINSYKKPLVKEQFKDAISLVVFCQMADIVLEPAYAVYEKIGYDICENKMNEILDDLELFYRIDSADCESLTQYVLGSSKNFKLATVKPIDREFLASELTKYRRLTEWDSMYLFMLKLACVHLESTDKPGEKLKFYVEWLLKEFRLSLVAIVFAVVFFGKKPLPKMIKFKSSQTPNQKKASITNMTWDLYIMGEYFRSCVSQGSKRELMYASGDRAFLGVLKYAIKIQETGSLKCMDDHLPQELLAHIDHITQNPNSCAERIYKSKEWCPDYRTKLIEKYERRLGISVT